MNFGYVKVATFTPEIKVGFPQNNLESVFNGLVKANKKGVEVLVMPELCLTGCTCGDLFYSDLLIENALNSLKRLVEFSKDYKMLVCVGLPFRYRGKLYSVGAIVNQGKLLALVPKSNLNDFEGEGRYFNGYFSDNVYIDVFGQKVIFGTKLYFKEISNNAFTVGVEISNDVNSLMPNSTILAGFGANLIVNLGKQEDYYSSNTSLAQTITSYSERINCAYAYSNAGEGESTSDYVYTGQSVIVEDGKKVEQIKDGALLISEVDLLRMQHQRRNKGENLSLLANVNSNDYEIIEFEANLTSDINIKKYSKTPFVPTDSNELVTCAFKSLDLQSEGLKARIKHTNCQTVVLGLSGGLDSTLAIIVAVKAMQKLNRNTKDIIAVTMPCFGTTSRTLENSIKLAKAFNTTLLKVDISKSVTRHLRDIKHLGDLDVTFENAQARERTQVLMDIANMKGGIVVGTGDLSEMALGWATYNGDHMSMYGVNCSVPKTLVRHIVYNFAKSTKGKLKSVLLDILDTPVSPELLPAENGKIAQKTENIVGPYVLHDFFLYHYVKNNFSPEKILFIACQTFEGDFDRATIEKWLKTFFRRFFTQQFKRSCVPDGVKVGEISLSPRGGWKMPSDATSTLWLESLNDIK